MTDPAAPPTGSPEELKRLRAERDAAVAALDADGRRARRHGRLRQAGAAVLVVLFAVLVPLTTTLTWTHRTVLNTDNWVSTVRPIAASPVVTAAVSRRVTDELYTSLNPQQIVANALPPKAAFLAGPIANGARSYVEQGVNKALSSAQFQTLWDQSNRFASAQLIAVLRGNTKVLQTTNGNVVLNLVPLLNAALQNVQGFASSVVGKPITLPTITSNEIPAAACQRISATLGRPVPATCGQIPLFRAAELTTAQRGVRAFDRGVVALLVITPLLAVGAMWLSRRRRRTLLQLAIGGMIGVVVLRRLVFLLRGDLVKIGLPENKAAREVIVDTVLRGLLSITEWLLVGGAVIVVLALLTGPYRWAVRMRAGVQHGGLAVWHLAAAGAGRATDDRTQAWIRQHVDALRVAVGVVAALLVLILSLNVWGLLAIAVVAVGLELWLRQLKPNAITLPDARKPADASSAALPAGDGSGASSSRRR